MVFSNVIEILPTAIFDYPRQMRYSLNFRFGEGGRGILHLLRLALPRGTLRLKQFINLPWWQSQSMGEVHIGDPS